MAVRIPILNVQSQERYVWPRSLTVAKAYLDQLERSGSLSHDPLAEIRSAIGKGDRSLLKKHVGAVKKAAASAKNATDRSRLAELAAILENPAA
jgi:hypothetical protein